MYLPVVYLLNFSFNGLWNIYRKGVMAVFVLGIKYFIAEVRCVVVVPKFRICSIWIYYFCVFVHFFE